MASTSIRAICSITRTAAARADRERGFALRTAPVDSRPGRVCFFPFNLRGDRDRRWRSRARIPLDVRAVSTALPGALAPTAYRTQCRPPRWLESGPVSVRFAAFPAEVSEIRERAATKVIDDPGARTTRARCAPSRVREKKKRRGLCPRRSPCVGMTSVRPSGRTSPAASWP
jgi:hypothetical protein